ncbi:MAG: hypothetical protein WB974_14215 [Acidobacteriaceae bacterium]
MKSAQAPAFSSSEIADESGIRDSVTGSVSSYFRCPEQYVRLAVREPSGSDPGYFRFGPDITCFGSCSDPAPSLSAIAPLPDASRSVTLDRGVATLPFDPAEIVSNLYRERYVGEWRSGSASLLANLYYFVRPVLPVSVRKHLQKIRLSDWETIPFPRWPVDCSIDNLFEQLLLISLRQCGVERIPFIWFWPEGRSACILMTHDVETQTGRDFCSTLMDFDASFGIRASLQVIPEGRYTVTPEFLESIRSRGFEVVVHDLNHDGHLYKNREQFLARAAKINQYGREFGAQGFRAAVLYRKQIWYDALKFSFDMSVPNVAHLDPQRGGCCTVMPYFLGDIVELPVTTTQDYSLFSILDDYSIDLWKRQTAIILARHGLMSFIIHPDYVMQPRQHAVHEELLRHLVHLREQENAWVALPGEVNRWWRDRAAMRLVESDGRWEIQGPGKERARLAWASEKNGCLALTLDACETAAALPRGTP